MEEPESFPEEGVFDRPLPNSSEAEQAVLGLIILDNTLFFQTLELLQPEDFYLPSHQKIYRAMLSCFERGEDLTVISINEELKKRNESQTVGGITTLIHLGDGIPHTASLEHYLRPIKGTAKLRRLISISNTNLEAAMAADDEPEAILSQAEQRLFDLTSERYQTGLVRVNTVLDTVIENAERNGRCGMTADGLDTGFLEFNRITSGLQRSDLILIAGRPGAGKTSFAQCILNNAGIRGDKLCAFFSLEMAKEAIIGRGLCAEARIDHQRYRNGYLNETERGRIHETRATYENAAIYIDDTPAITVLELKAKCLRLQAELRRQLDLVVVDFLQLMKGTRESRRESRQQEVANVCADLKTVAKELRVPLVALSQLSRASEGRNDKRPQLADLRESGTLEQTADLVAFVYREALHNKDLSDEEKHLAELIISKQRNGPTGVIMLRFEGPWFRFDNLRTDF